MGDSTTGANLPLTTLYADPDAPGSPEEPGVQCYPSTAPGTNPVECLCQNGTTNGKGGLGKTEVEEKEEEKEKGGWQSERMYWGNKREYILSTLGFCVGLGNLFRFPYLCNRNGGGAFLIPFMLSLLLIGMPLFALEVALGQFSGRNAQQVWAICPLFKGAGMGMVIVSAVCFYYYNTLMAWGFYYMGSSFTAQLPWGRCDGWWNTPLCFTYSDLKNKELAALDPRNGSSSAVNESFVANSYTMMSDAGNITETETNASMTNLVSSTEEFFQHNVLQLSGGFGETGSVVWYLALTLALSFVVIFFALFKGIRSSGKVVYVTATAPYVLVTALLIRGATLPGAVDGVIFYLKPDFSKLAEPQVWVEAALQVFYSLGPSWGGLVVMASFNKFHNNFLRDAMLITLFSEGTSIYGGFAIFSVMGYMAHVSGQAIDKVVSSGPGLAFIAYPEAISLMPLPQLWAVFFFIMVITLAIDTNMANAEVMLTTIIDFHPRLLSRHRSVVTAIFCVLLYVLSLPYVTQGGMYLFQLVDWFVAALSLISIGLVECLVVGWIYGVSRIGDDMYLMLGRRPPSILYVFWKFITPSILLVLLVTTLVNYKPPTYGDYEYGVGAKVFGWCVALVSFLPIPAFAVYRLLTARGSLKQRLRQTVKPDYTIWKPADDQASLMYGKERQLHV